MCVNTCRSMTFCVPLVQAQGQMQLYGAGTFHGNPFMFRANNVWGGLSLDSSAHLAS